MARVAVQVRSPDSVKIAARSRLYATEGEILEAGEDKSKEIATGFWAMKPQRFGVVIMLVVEGRGGREEEMECGSGADADESRRESLDITDA